MSTESPAASPLIVAQDGTGQFTQIDAALKRASLGSTIIVRPGFYQGFKIDKRVQILGEGPVEQIVVNGSSDLNNFCVLFETPYAEISSLTLHEVSMNQGHLVMRSCNCVGQIQLHKKTSKLTLQKSTIHDVESFAMYVGDGLVEVDECEIQHNDSGIQVDRGSVLAFNSRIRFNRGYAFDFSGSGQATVEKCDLSGNGGGICYPNNRIKKGKDILNKQPISSLGPGEPISHAMGNPKLNKPGDYVLLDIGLSVVLIILWWFSLFWLNLNQSGWFFILIYLLLGLIIPPILVVALVDVIIPGLRADYVLQKELWTRPAAAALANLVRRLFGKPNLMLVPENGSKKVETALALTSRILETLKFSPMSQDKKTRVIQQATQVPRNILNATQKQLRLRDLDLTISMHNSQQARSSLKEVKDLQATLDQEITHSLDILTTLSVSVVGVEIAHGAVALENLLTELSQSNQRLRDLASSYQDSEFKVIEQA